MRLAVAGKGGAGKTTISATIAKLAARQGRTVVAVDGDSNPNLGMALGISADELTKRAVLPSSLVSRRFDRPGLNEPVEEVIDRYAMRGSDGVRLLLMGMPEHADEGCLCSAHATISALLGDLGRSPDTLTILDLEGSPEHLSRGTARHADVLLLVAEPYYRALETVRRHADLARELEIDRIAVVLNKARRESDGDAGAEFCANHDLELAGVIPWTEEVLDADQARRPLVDAAPTCSSVAAIERLATSLGALLPEHLVAPRT